MSTYCVYHFRCLAICRPLSSFDWRTTKLAKSIIVVVSILSVIYGGLIVYTTSFSGPKNCTSVGKGSKITDYLSWFMLVVLSLFPFFSILIMNFLIVRTIRNRPASDLQEAPDTLTKSSSVSTISHSTGEKSSQNEHIGSFRRSRKQKGKRERKEISGQLVLMLLAVSFAFLILTSPVSIGNVIYALGLFTVNSNRKSAQSALIIAITSRLILVNGVINFWLYFVTGAKFRQDLKNLVCKCLRRTP